MQSLSGLPMLTSSTLKPDLGIDQCIWDLELYKHPMDMTPTPSAAVSVPKPNPMFPMHENRVVRILRIAIVVQELERHVNYGYLDP